MSKKLLLVFFITMGGINLAGGKATKTGVIEENVFTDAKYNYQFTAPETWKIKAEKEPSLLRAILQKTKVEKYGTAMYGYNEIAIPSLLVYVDTTSLSLENFCQLLLEKPKRLPNSEEYMLKMEFLINSEVAEEKRILVDSLPAKKILMKKKYFKTVRDPRERYGPQGDTQLVEDFLLGIIVVFKKENQVYILHGSGDREIFKINAEDWLRIISSWKFIKTSTN